MHVLIRLTSVPSLLGNSTYGTVSRAPADRRSLSGARHTFLALSHRIFASTCVWCSWTTEVTPPHPAQWTRLRSHRTRCSTTSSEPGKRARAGSHRRHWPFHPLAHGTRVRQEVSRERVACCHDWLPRPQCGKRSSEEPILAGVCVSGTQGSNGGKPTASPGRATSSASTGAAVHQELHPGQSTGLV